MSLVSPPHGRPSMWERSVSQSARGSRHMGIWAAASVAAVSASAGAHENDPQNVSGDDGSTGDPTDGAMVDEAEAGGAVQDVGVDAPCPTGGKALSFNGTSRVDIP